MTTLAVVVLIGSALIGAGYQVSYNRFVANRQAIADGWAAIDVELVRRHELVPQLIRVVQQAAAHERAVLVRAAEANARAVAAPHRADVATQVEPPLATAVATLVALRERYPALNAQQVFVDLQHRLAITEDRLAAARRFYNTRVAELNRRIGALPSALVARRHGIGRAEYYDPD